MMGTVHNLTERPVTFDYEYNMSCPDCAAITTVTSTDYYNEPNGAHVPCAHCGGDIHFGPAVMALRDATDPVLTDHYAYSAAWYHTSTEPDWPTEARPLPQSEVEFLARAMPPEEVRRVCRNHENQALHLGTYEAAIETMLRRMRNQDDGGAQFYLFRAALRHVLTIEQGYRDENYDEAAHITQAELGPAHAIRYLNVREARGSVSLAVRKEAIASVQAISLPGHVIIVAETSPLHREIARIRAEVAQIEATRPAELDGDDRLQQSVARKLGQPFTRSAIPEQHALLMRISKLIEDEYLPGISLSVRADFVSALEAWRSSEEVPPDDAAYVSRFASLARMLTHPRETIHELAGQTVRKL